MAWRPVPLADLITPLSYRCGRCCLSPVHCSGGIILGFEQFRASGGLKKRGTAAEEHVSTSIPFRTAWNHLESGIPFGLHLPTRCSAKTASQEVYSIPAFQMFSFILCRHHIKGAAKDALRQDFRDGRAGFASINITTNAANQHRMYSDSES